MTFEVWDLAGQANLRPSWASYYAQTNAILVVADSTDRCTRAAGRRAGRRAARPQLVRTMAAGAWRHCLSRCAGLAGTLAFRPPARPPARLPPPAAHPQPQQRMLDLCALQSAHWHPEAGAVQAAAARTSSGRLRAHLRQQTRPGEYKPLPPGSIALLCVQSGSLPRAQAIVCSPALVCHLRCCSQAPWACQSCPRAWT